MTPAYGHPQECGVIKIEGAVRENRYIDVVTTIAGNTHRKIIDTEERFIREGLIKLGWTPPREAVPAAEWNGESF